MIKVDENALICDLAETYQIYDYKHMPPTKVAIFANGLRSESRIMMKLANLKVSAEIMLSAGILDRLSLMLWMQTKDGQKGINRPNSIVDSLQGKTQAKDVSAFVSGEEFERERQRIMKGGN